MDRETAENLVKEFRDYAKANGMNLPANWFTTEAARILSESLFLDEVSVEPKGVPSMFNQELHEAEAILDDRLEKIRKARQLFEDAIVAVSKYLFQLATGGAA